MLLWAASTLLTAGDASCNPFAKRVEADVDAVLKDYILSDKEPLRGLLGTRLDVQLRSARRADIVP